MCRAIELVLAPSVSPVSHFTQTLPHILFTFGAQVDFQSGFSVVTAQPQSGACFHSCAVDGMLVVVCLTESRGEGVCAFFSLS